MEVLTGGNWPVKTDIKLTVPKQMARCQERFDIFYKNKHNNRQLTWLWTSGTAELKPLFVTTKQHQLVMNNFQAVVCLLFNEHSVLTWNEIKEKTQIPDANLQPALINLCKPQVKLLAKEFNKPAFAPDEKIQVNLKFSNNQTRLSVVPVSTSGAKQNVEKNKEEDKETEKIIRQQRHNTCDS